MADSTKSVVTKPDGTVVPSTFFADNGIAPLASPALTGTPTAPTAEQGTNTTQLATTAFVRSEVSALIDGAPGVLDTLKELSDALGADADFAGSMTTALGGKASTAALEAHTDATNNPHAVTKSQVGLGNCNNTADADKPVSTATQTALDLKAPLASPALTGAPTAPTAAPGTNTTQLATTAFVTAALAGAGGAAHPGASVAYVFPATGNDTTGDGTLAKPWATLQKAVTEGRTLIILGPGDVGELTLPATKVLTVHPLGGVTIGAIYTGGYDLSLYNAGSGNQGTLQMGAVYANGAGDGAAGGSLALYNLYITGAVSAGGQSGSIGGNGGNGGQISLFDCTLVSTLSATGGPGGSGTEIGLGGNGGNGGTIYINPGCIIMGTIESNGGAEGADAGTGAGSMGAPGTINAQQSQITTPIYGSLNAVACVVDGVFVP